MTILYGIPNCDTVKKARSWLADKGIETEFHDFKKAGVTPELIKGWLADVPWDVLLNRKGTTWRGLPEPRKAAITDSRSAMALMLELPSVIKRPVLVNGKKTTVGFSDALYQDIFKKSA
jgi:arsenate reductase